MKRTLLLICFLALTVVYGGVISQASAGIESGSSRYFAKLRGKARQSAHRTFIYERNYGGPHAAGQHKRRFSLRGQDSYTVRSPDESLLTAFQATLSSADGTGDIVLLFRNLHFVGWASNRLAGNLFLGRRGTRILVRYFVYRSSDAFCCPSSKKAITYAWNGSRVVASGKPPLVFGKPGQRLHWVGGRAAASSFWRKCGRLPSHFAFNIVSRNVPCGGSRRVVRRWGKTAAQQPGGDGWVSGLYCNYRDVGYEAGAIRCAHHGRVVRWQTAS